MAQPCPATSPASSSNSSNHVSLNDFLQLYQLPACQISATSGSLLASNAAFDLSCTADVLAQLRNALAASHASPPPAVLSVQEALWSITRTDTSTFTLLAQAWQAQTTVDLSCAWQDHPRFARLASGGGEMGERLRTFDWSNTELGPIHAWPQSLVELVALMLHSPLPTAAYVGPNAILVYNDAYIPVMGKVKHPAFLGTPGREAWSEIFDSIDAPLRDCYEHGKVTRRAEQQLFFNRITDKDVGMFNAPEEVFVTWSYDPWMGANGKPIGILHHLFEQTHLNPIAARRMNVLVTLGASLASQATVTDLYRSACSILSTLDRDLPYCMAYTCQSPEDQPVPHDMLRDGLLSVSSADSQAASDQDDSSSDRVFVLQETVGCEFGSALAPNHITLSSSANENDPSDSSGHFWREPLVEMCATQKRVSATGVEALLANVPGRGYDSAVPVRAILVPLVYNSEVFGCFIFCLSPLLPYEETGDLQRFIKILSRQLNFGLQAVRNYELEVARREELAALDRAKTNFFTSVSHELRTPLTLILGPAQELANDASLSSAARDYNGLVLRNTKRLLRLVNSILDFARCEAGKMHFRFEPVKIGRFTTDLAGAFEGPIKAAGLDMRVDTTNSADTIAWLDADKYEKICYNLLSNALKWTSKGHISITMGTGQQFVWLQVTDTGAGIPADELGTIFEKFHRVESAQARSIEGSGIGLSLTMELVKAHGGKLTVQSSMGQGSTFQVRFPLGNSHLPKQYLSTPMREHAPGIDLTDEPLLISQEAVNQSTTMSQVSSDGLASTSNNSTESLFPPILFFHSKRPLVLIADDNVDMRHFIKSILCQHCDIVEAKNGQEAWEIIERGGVDLVVSDLQMPYLSGLQLLRRVRDSADEERLPFILLSARAGEEARIEGFTSGADDYLSKPFSSKELLLRSHQHLQLLSMRRELEPRVRERTSALETSKQSFQRLSELLRVGVHRSGLDGEVTWANHKWYQVLGLEPNAVGNWAECIHPDDRGTAVQSYQRTIATGKGYEDPLEMRLIDNQGQVLCDITYDLQAEHNNAGEIIGYVGVFSDVTALRRLERERVRLERKRREEAEKNRAVQEEFIDSICHELRNPMQAIVALAELLGESLLRMDSLQRRCRVSPDAVIRQEWLELEQDIKEDLDAVATIILCSRHQKRIADDVLHVSKLSGNLVVLSVTDFSPLEAVSNTLRMFALEVSAKSISLSLECDRSYDSLEGLNVIGDAGRFQQICVNLLANAIKFSEATPKQEIRVRIGLSPVGASAKNQGSSGAFTQNSDLLPECTPLNSVASGDQLSLWVAVADSGRGISAAEQSRIFQRFVQASPKTYREFGGVGLGLYISRKLAELHGGRIFLESAEGVGTAFRFYVNVTIADSKMSKPPSLQPLQDVAVTDMIQTGSLNFSGSPTEQTASLPFGFNASVLVVEDNKINQKVLCRLLDNLHCDVTAADDGEDCLQHVERRLQGDPTRPPFDLILMDLEMPIMDGMAATQKLRALETAGRWPGLQKIIAVTANARQTFEEQARDIGMDGFLRKPYSKFELSELLKQFVQPLSKEGQAS